MLMPMLQGAGVTSYAMHPGWTVTEGVKKSIPGFYERFKGSMRDLQQGTDTIVWLALEVNSPSAHQGLQCLALIIHIRTLLMI